MAKVHTQFSHVCTLSHPTLHYIKSHKNSIRITCKVTTSHHGNVTTTTSPFTEAHSVPMCVHSNVSRGTPPIRKCDEKFDRKEENDIILQLPELHEMLGLLKNSRKNVEDKGDDGVGNVYLVGTGPGDPELLTLKAYRLLQSAHLVLYDRLVSSEIMDMVHPGARLLYVGKTAGYHSRTQDEIHQLLLSFAEAGATVVRLKGGDPLVFGRGGEEMDFLQQQGIAVKVIPGITAASGIAAELGIPLTHRGVANSVRFLTGHSRKGGTDPIFVEKLSADSDMTLVVYMGLATLPALVQKLVSDGLSVKTPAVAVERGTTPQQREVFSTLKELPDAVKRAQLVSPTLIIIGNVVALSTYWSEKKFCSEQGIDACVASEMS